MKTYRFGIVGYGNLGRGVELAVQQNPDMELKAIFTRRNPQSINAKYLAYSIDELHKFRGLLDVVILCGGSAQDLPEQIEKVACHFNTVDSFDTHASIPRYYEKVDAINRVHGTLSLISAGWDPGLFSMLRLLGLTLMPTGKGYTFWGKGVSQGHSDAIRRVPGVKNGVQYTIPKYDALQRVRVGEEPTFAAADKHTRVCFVVAEENADRKEIEKAIKGMPHYFDGYETIVHFVDEKTLLEEHSKMPHGGVVVTTGKSANGNRHMMECSLTLESNPEFTSGVLMAYARAVARMAAEGHTGCKTVFDIPLGYLSPQDAAVLRKELL